VTGEHPNPDSLFVTLIHQALRVDADRLVAATSTLQSADAERLSGLRLFFDEYREQLGTHHAHEDNLFFPALQAILDADRLPLAEIAAQHGTLDADLEAIREGLASLAAPTGDFAVHRKNVVNIMVAMTAHLDAHLTVEEQTILPLVESTLPSATYKQLEAQARKQTPRRRTKFMIPWLMAHATPGQQRALLKSAPPLRAVYLVNRRRYRLLDRALTC
jgi:hemerythrin-like domain-containing protein